MPIRILKQSIFETDCQVITNPVNCVGVMGAGLAKQFKKRYPKYFYHYYQLCYNHKIEVGKVDLYDNNEIVICSFPTKNHWRNRSKYWYIEKGIYSLYLQLMQNDYISIALPFLGCGLGGLKKDNVLDIIKNEFNKTNIDVLICDY